MHRRAHKPKRFQPRAPPTAFLVTSDPPPFLTQCEPEEQEWQSIAVTSHDVRDVTPCDAMCSIASGNAAHSSCLHWFERAPPPAHRPAHQHSASGGPPGPAGLRGVLHAAGLGQPPPPPEARPRLPRRGGGHGLGPGTFSGAPHGRSVTLPCLPWGGCYGQAGGGGFDPRLGLVPALGPPWGGGGSASSLFSARPHFPASELDSLSAGPKTNKRGVCKVHFNAQGHMEGSAGDWHCLSGCRGESLVVSAV